MDPKLLTEDGWRAIAQKSKIKDNGLQRALAAYEKIDDDEHEDRLKGIASVGQLAGSLKKVKEVVAAPAVVKYLNDLISAAEAEKSEVAKAKVAAEKAEDRAGKTDAMSRKKAEADAKKREQEEDKQDAEEDAEEDEEEEEEADYKVKLLAAYQKLKSARRLSYQFIVCDAKPQCGLMVARRITTKHKQELTKITGGSKRFLKVGTCRVDSGKFIFEMQKPPVGLARKLLISIKYFTGKRIPVIVGAETAEDEKEDQSSLHPEAGQPQTVAGRPRLPTSGEPEDEEETEEPETEAPQDEEEEADKEEEQPQQEDEEEEAQPGRSSGAAASRHPVDAPPARPTLARAPEVWQQTQRFIETNLDQLKTSIREAFVEDGPEVLDKVESSLGKLDRILHTLDQKLADSLAKAHAANDPTARNNELKNAKAILANYIKYVKSEPMIAQIDSNPFGVNANLKRKLTESLTHMAQAIGQIGPTR